MKILMCNRPDPFEVPGGETIQMVETRRALEALGHQVDFSTDLHPDVQSYDVIHLFNLTMVAHAHAQSAVALAQGKPVVLSTIYYTWDEFERYGRDGAIRLLNRLLPSIDLRERAKALVRAAKHPRQARGYVGEAWQGYRRMQVELLRRVHVILPNSMAERDVIYRDFPEARPACQVAPNAAAAAYGTATAADFTRQYGLSDFILCVARVDSRKNQVAMMEALEGIGRKVVFIGGRSPNHAAYWARFERKLKSSDQFVYLGPLPPAVVASAYRAAAVHVLPSWLETPGLASLEAALAGCRVVSTDRGSPPEYFGNLAEYCDPRSPASIRQAVERSLARAPDPRLQQHVAARFTWQAAAEASIAGYRLAQEINQGRPTGSVGLAAATQGGRP